MRWALLVCLLLGALGLNAESLRVASWNVDNYTLADRWIDGQRRRDYPKPEAEKSALRATLRELNADIVAIQEIGGEPYLRELAQDLAREGLEYPHHGVAQGEDEVRQLGVLSKQKWLRLEVHDNLKYTYFGERRRLTRGLLEVVFDAGNDAEWSLFVVHLKSKRTVRRDDFLASKQRLAEAEAVRDFIADRYQPGDGLYLITGDVNATLTRSPSSASPRSASASSPRTSPASTTAETAGPITGATAIPTHASTTSLPHPSWRAGSRAARATCLTLPGPAPPATTASSGSSWSCRSGPTTAGSRRRRRHGA